MSRHDDMRMLQEILDAAQSWDDERVEAMESTLAAFVDMLSRLERGGRDLSEKQRAWVSGVHENVTGTPNYENAWSAGKVPRGREVATPEVLKRLPLKPPRRMEPT
jgi:hypothetical protein